MGQLLTHIVCRSFGDDTIKGGDPLRRRLAGECVNAVFWRNFQGLEKNRHIIPMPEGLEPVADTFGRLWVDLEMLHKAEREALSGTVPVPDEAKPPPVVAAEQEQAVAAPTKDDYALPQRSGNPAGQYTKYELWDGSIVVGKAKALEAHEAGVNADLERRSLESQAPAAGVTSEDLQLKA